MSKQRVFECAAVELNINKKCVVIISLYRPRISNYKIFFDKLERLLASVHKQNINKIVTLSGDLNIDFRTSGAEKSQRTYCTPTIWKINLVNLHDDAQHMLPLQ